MPTRIIRLLTFNQSACLTFCFYPILFRWSFVYKQDINFCHEKIPSFSSILCIVKIFYSIPMKLVRFKKYFFPFNNVTLWWHLVVLQKQCFKVTESLASISEWVMKLAFYYYMQKSIVSKKICVIFNFSQTIGNERLSSRQQSKYDVANYWMNMTIKGYLHKKKNLSILKGYRIT